MNTAGQRTLTGPPKIVPGGGGGVGGWSLRQYIPQYRKLEWMAASHVGERRILRINIHIEGKGRSSSVCLIFVSPCEYKACTLVMVLLLTVGTLKSSNFYALSLDKNENVSWKMPEKIMVPISLHFFS
jgi:hypothetical protein